MNELCELINVDTLYTCKTVVIIIGATRCVHNKVIAGLKMLGISTRKSKAVAKYMYPRAGTSVLVLP